jgi:AcrR family transcriptional regulator
MARTLDPEAHAVRRDEFIGAAQRLIGSKGYEQMSIQDVLDDTGASKGAFYHYFDSKAALLDSIVERMVDEGVTRLGPTLDDPETPALVKFEAFFTGLAQFKAERRDLILGFMRAWLSDDNAIVREHFRRGLVTRLEPVMTAIVRQGVAERVFTVTSPEASGRVLVALFQGLNEDVSALFLRLVTGAVSIEQFEVRLLAYTEAFERILGAAPGTLKFGDMSVIHDWVRWSRERRKDWS